MGSVYTKGSFNGIPYQINYARGNWDTVDPCAALGIAFAAFTCPNESPAEFINFPKGYVEKFAQAVHAVCEPKLKIITNNLKKELGPAAWKSSLNNQTPEKYVSEFIDKNSQSAQSKELKHLLTLAEVPYREQVFRGPVLGEVALGLYFNQDGSAIDKNKETVWENFQEKINNWMFNLVYNVKIPGRSSTEVPDGVFYDCAEPTINKECDVAVYVRGAINDALRQRKRTAFEVEVPYISEATPAEKESASPSPVKLYADTAERAAAIVDFYAGEGIEVKASSLVEKTKERQ